MIFERVKSELTKMTVRLEYIGQRTDLAAVNKLFGNAMIIGVVSVMADVLALAQASRVDAEDAIKLLGLLDLNAMVAGARRKYGERQLYHKL